MKKIIRLLIHPLFIYAVIFALECIPYKSNAPKVILQEMPKPGDNFSIPDSDGVFFYNGKGKYAYPSVECYYSFDNPTFDVDYQHGGIKTISKKLADRIPFLGYMCEQEQVAKVGKPTQKALNKYFSVNYLLTNFSDFSHVFFYFLLSFFMVFHFRKHKFKSGLTFAICFAGGGFLEFFQYLFVYSRTASWTDQALNTVGAFLGLAAFYSLQRIRFVDLLDRHLKSN